MADLFKPPYGTYTTPAALNNSARAALTTAVANLKALIPSGTTGVATTYMTDFDQIPPHTAYKIQAELDSLLAAMVAASTSTAGT